MKEYLIIAILSICSFIVIIIALKILLTIKKISTTGIQVEGVIFDLEQSIGSGSSVSYPIVRFLTRENIWVTKQASIGGAPGMYKKGKKVNVIYQQVNPDNFYIKDNLTYLIPIVMAIIGAVLLSIALFQLIHI